MNYYTASAIILCISALALASCVTNSRSTDSESTTKQSWDSKTTVVSVKKPKYAPYDWTPKDADSREIWFKEENQFQDFCDGTWFTYSVPIQIHVLQWQCDN